VSLARHQLRHGDEEDLCSLPRRLLSRREAGTLDEHDLDIVQGVLNAMRRPGQGSSELVEAGAPSYHLAPREYPAMG
jgi:pantothenate kinase-related protein Tda10